MSPGETRERIEDLLKAWRGGDDDALRELMPLVYRELKTIASRHLRGRRGSETLQTTALVHEIYPRLLRVREVSWTDSAHFYAMCARLMRRVLIDHARHHRRDKRGGGMPILIFDELLHSPDRQPPEVLAVEEALCQLARHDPERARIVELRFFGGLQIEEIAEVLELSSATVKRRLRSARAWMKTYLRDGAA
ncbi:MAG: ECF-type sigma factor [Holophagales bacterium]|nr:ECF-type sigma factor [Holophagales bacterium]